MRKLDSKFFITCLVIIAIPILFVIMLFMFRSCSMNHNYEEYEKMMVNRSKIYAKKHKMFPSVGKSVIIKLSDLEEDGLKSAEKYLKDKTCSGSVTIENVSNDYSTDKKKYYSYTPYLECNNYKSGYLKEQILKSLTTSKSGLYKVGDEYIFKGDKVNNYITFYGNKYRIIKIDANNRLKLIKSEPQVVSSSWDNKYNISNNSYDGINNYEDSNILERLIQDYNNVKNISKEARNHLMLTDVCIGKRSMNNKDKNITTECEQKIKNQVLTLPSITDFTLASNDVNCKQIGDLSCTNYNYLSDMLDVTWTVDTITEDSSKVYYLSSQGPDLYSANRYTSYNLVIYISADEIYKSGDGSLEKPYIVG